MLRCDMDALPITEATNLPYASEVTVSDEPDVHQGVGVMHACGHDVHMTNLVGVAWFLMEHKQLWSGTLMLVAQPAEERGAGAAAMLTDGLFERFPKPDFAVALHVASDVAAGKVQYRARYAMANVDSVDITMKGRGGHGAAPHTAVDPVVQAAQLVLALQTIVSREVNPIEPAVVTVGAIHGGSKHNVIGDTCHLQLTVRSYTDAVRQQVLDAICRQAAGVAATAGAPEPDVAVSEGTPALFNGRRSCRATGARFSEGTGGRARWNARNRRWGGEDFSRYGRAGVPILMFRLGSVEARRLDRYRQLGIPAPSLHSASYYPDIEPTLVTGITAMSAAVLNLLPPTADD